MAGGEFPRSERNVFPLMSYFFCDRLGKQKIVLMLQDGRLFKCEVGCGRPGGFFQPAHDGVKAYACDLREQVVHSRVATDQCLQTEAAFFGQRLKFDAPGGPDAADVPSGSIAW